MTTTSTLLLRPPEAAAELRISERTLWAQTAPRGPIRCVRIGGSVRYSRDALQAYIDQQMSAADQEVER